MSKQTIDWRIYGLVDNVEFAEKLLRAGVKVIQYRNKDETDEIFVENAKKVKELCAQYGAALIVNDRYQLVKEIGADGVHVGLQDARVEKVRRELGDNFVVGLSVKTVEDAKEGKESGVDYVCVSPIFDTPNKEEKGVGLEVLRDIARELGEDMPVLVIGGITEKNLSEVVEAGAEGVAMIGELQKAAQEGEEVLREKVQRMEKIFPSREDNEGKERYENHRRV